MSEEIRLRVPAHLMEQVRRTAERETRSVQHQILRYIKLGIESDERPAQEPKTDRYWGPG